MLMLDPFYRTIRGFEVLIEKEWCSTGHRFDTRSGHGSKNSTDSQRAPIFPQWLDCVHQLISQFPHHFQFNEHMLLEIGDALYTCEYGTFLYDCDKDRQLYARSYPKPNSSFRYTISLWSEINAHLSRYANIKFRQELVDRIYPRHETKFLFFWKANYLRYLDGGSHHLEPEKEVILLKRRLTELEKLIQKEKERKKIIRKTCEPLGRSHTLNAPSETRRVNQERQSSAENVEKSTEVSPSGSEIALEENESDSVKQSMAIQYDESAPPSRSPPSLPSILQWQIASFQKSELRAIDPPPTSDTSLRTKTHIPPSGLSIASGRTTKIHESSEDSIESSEIAELSKSSEIHFSQDNNAFADPPKNPPPPVPTSEKKHPKLLPPRSHSDVAVFRNQLTRTPSHQSRPVPPPKNTKPVLATSMLARNLKSRENIE